MAEGIKPAAFVSGNTVPLQKRIEALEEENTALAAKAAWQCLHHDGKKGIVYSEPEGQFCQTERENQILHKMFDGLATYLFVHGIDVHKVRQEACEALGVSWPAEDGENSKEKKADVSD